MDSIPHNKLGNQNFNIGNLLSFISYLFIILTKYEGVNFSKKYDMTLQ